MTAQFVSDFVRTQVLFPVELVKERFVSPGCFRIGHKLFDGGPRFEYPRSPQGVKTSPQVPRPGSGSQFLVNSGRLTANPGAFTFFEDPIKLFRWGTVIRQLETPIWSQLFLVGAFLDDGPASLAVADVDDVGFI